MKLIDFNEKEITIEMSVDEYTTISAALGSASVYMGDGNNVKKIAQEFKDLTKEVRCYGEGCNSLPETIEFVEPIPLSRFTYARRSLKKGELKK